jgi:hypothetical protein
VCAWCGPPVRYGGLDWLHLPGLAGTSSLCWLPPILCFSVTCGLALDYDVFLWTSPASGLRCVPAVPMPVDYDVFLLFRCLEFREEGCVAML